MVAQHGLKLAETAARAARGSLHEARHTDVEKRTAALASLPELIRSSSQDGEVESRIADVLVQGIACAHVAAVVQLTSEGTAGPQVEARATATRDRRPAELQPRRELVLDAVRRRQSALYRWGFPTHEDTIAPEELDWAVCAPLPEACSPGWALYAAGRLQGLPRHAPSRQADVLTSYLTFVGVVADIFAALREVRGLQAERVQMLASLRLAREIQAGFFPRALPAVPGYELAAGSRSADATGGDYCDVLSLGSGRLGLVVADVCGHGLGPSLLMASLRGVLRGFAVREPAPAALLGELGQALYDDLAPCHRFITLLYGSLAPAEHRFDYANAGHGPVALHFQAARGRFSSLAEDDRRGCPLGIRRERYQPCAPVALAPGDLLVLGSDGIVETHRAGARFGMARLEQLILRLKDRPLQEVVDRALEATSAFHEGGRPDDDMTLLLVRRI